VASIHPDVPNFSWSELTPNHCTEKELVAHCCLAVGEEFNFDGIGIYPDKGFVHLDMRGYVARWDG
jgi:hypothetical protein